MFSKRKFLKTATAVASDSMAREHEKWLIQILAGLTVQKKLTFLALLGKHKVVWSGEGS